MAFGGYSYNATLNYDNSQALGTTAVTVTLNFGVINNSQPQQVPVITPYGYISIPPDDSFCVYEAIGDDYLASHVVGYNNSLMPTSNLANLQKGESALFSGGDYTYQIKNDKLYIIFTNSSDDVIETRVTIDENVNTVLIDTIAEIKSLETNYNTLLLKFNTVLTLLATAVQPGSGIGGVPSPQSPYAATANFIRDDTFLGSTGTNNFVNDDGMLIT